MLHRQAERETGDTVYMVNTCSTDKRRERQVTNCTRRIHAPQTSGERERETGGTVYMVNTCSTDRRRERQVINYTWRIHAPQTSGERDR